jgi:hypothetical protein
MIKSVLNGFLFYACGLFLIVFAACQHNNSYHLSKKVNIKIDRFEKDLFSINIYNLCDSIPYLTKKYPEFFPLFSAKIIQIGEPDQPGFSDRLLAFVSDFTIYNVNKRVNVVFPDLNNVQKEISQVFGIYSSVFPNHSVPNLITCISGFNQSIVITDSLLIISLDKYLGSNDEFYKLLYPPVPEYVRYVMHPSKIPSDVIRAWLVGEFPYNDVKNNLLSQMIFEGRVMYSTKQIMPAINDTLLWGFTPVQLEFCRKNEKQMWTFLVENKLLFGSDKFMITQYIHEAPFTKDFSKESPGRAAVWIGYRIIDSFMKQDKSVTLNTLMDETDYLKILNLSKYNP